MKKCVKCGCEIENGVNGCMIMAECFKCHGGYPKYPKMSGRKNRNDSSLYWEGRILERQERYDD